MPEARYPFASRFVVEVASDSLPVTWGSSSARARVSFQAVVASRANATNSASIIRDMGAPNGRGVSGKRISTVRRPTASVHGPTG